MKNVKKGIFVLLSVAILFEIISGNYFAVVRVNAQSGNNDHFSVQKATNTYDEMPAKNNLKINKYETIKKTGDNSEVEETEVLTREEELLSEGYVIVYENNTETELFFYNEELNDMKIIQYFEPTLELRSDGMYYPKEIAIKQKRDGTVNIESVNFDKQISQDKPLVYTQDGVDFEYYIENEMLLLDTSKDNKVTYKTENGFIVYFIVDKNNMVIQYGINGEDLSEKTIVQTITNDYSFKDDGDYFTVNGASNVVTIAKSNLDQRLDTSISKPAVKYAYDLDANTKMLKTKLDFSAVVVEKKNDEVKLIIEYISSIPVTTSGKKYLRGTRSNGKPYAYPYGSTPSNLSKGAPNETRYIRVGNNIDYKQIG